MLPNDPGDPTVEVDEVDPVDLEEPLAVRPAVDSHRSRRRLSALRIGLLVALGVGAGFVVGVQLQKGQAPAAVSTASGGTGFAGRTGFGGAAGATGATGSRTAGGTAGAAGGGATVGQVKLIDGTNVYVTDTSGNTVKVATTGSTISKSAPATVTDLAIGDTVIVRGATGSDGTVTATAITDSGAGGAAGFGRGGGGAGGG
jgi:hypothetical protein